MIRLPDRAFIPNHIFLDNRLSWGAKGLLVTLIAQDPILPLTKQALAKQSSDGRTRFYSLWKELEEMGYVKRISEVKGWRQVVRYELNIK